jgi:glycosyltransferase involved in cell wall biosynthesis
MDTRQLVLIGTALDRWSAPAPVYAAVVTWRAVVSVFKAPRARRYVASSHFLYDTLPAACLARWRRAQLAAYVFHLIGDSSRDRSLRSSLSRIAEWVSLELLRRTADVVFVDNDEVAASLARRGFRSVRLRSTSNAADPVQSIIPGELAPRPTVVFCGRLVAEKGVLDLIDLGRELSRRSPQAVIEILGDGPLRSTLMARSRDEGLNNLDFKGFVDDAQKWRMLCRAWVFVSPSREEGWGIAVDEAIYAGTPPVVYDLPAYERLGPLAVRVAIGDTKRLAEEVVRLLTDDHARGSWQNAVRPQTLPTWAEIISAEIGEMRAQCA